MYDETVIELRNYEKWLNLIVSLVSFPIFTGVVVFSVRFFQIGFDHRSFLVGLLIGIVFPISMLVFFGTMRSLMSLNQGIALIFSLSLVVLSIFTYFYFASPVIRVLWL